MVEMLNNNFMDQNQIHVYIYMVVFFFKIRSNSFIRDRTKLFFLPRDRVCSNFSGAGKFCLAHGLRQLIRDTVSDFSCLQTLLTRRNEKLRMTFGVGHHTTLIVNIRFKTLSLPIRGKKNNQSSVSDADREIPTLGSTDNAGNSVNLLSGIIRLPSGWDFSVCIGDR